MSRVQLSARKPAILIEAFRGFSQALQANSTLKLGHDGFLPNPFQFIIIHISLYHRRYVVWLLKELRKINYRTTKRPWKGMH
jgi:hypothetical protein